MADLHIGDSVGYIGKGIKDGIEQWLLTEDKITKIDLTKKYGERYHTKSKFYPLDAEDIDSNTKIMEKAVGNGYILTKEVFGINDITRPFAENWIKWANENMDKAVSVLEADEDIER
jgi:hypothetical protein